jgi:GTP-binding protein
LTEEETAETFHRRAPFLRFAPVAAVSAKTGYQVPQLLERAAWAAGQAKRKLTAAEKERLIEFLRKDRKAPVGVRNMGLVWAAQVATAPPVFHFVGRMERPLLDSDRAYLERVVRGLLKWEGTPIRIRTLRKGR